MTGISKEILVNMETTRLASVWGEFEINRFSFELFFLCKTWKMFIIYEKFLSAFTSSYEMFREPEISNPRETLTGSNEKYSHICVM